MLRRRKNRAQIKYEVIPQEEPDATTATYPPLETCNKLLECGIDKVLVCFICDNYDKGFIKPEFFEMMTPLWDLSPDDPCKATSALEALASLAKHAREITPGDDVEKMKWISLRLQLMLVSDTKSRY